MLYDETVNTYLRGEKFDNGAKIDLDVEKSNILYRDEYLLQVSKNKNILHLGFVDHLPLLDEKIKKGNWLHNKLTDISNKCYGIDINQEGIEYIQDTYKYDNLYALDVISDIIPKDILDIKFDYLLIPDVIEHIGNPVEFLIAIRDRFQNNVKKIILTTPNGFRWDNFINTFKKQEVINTDHRFWFTPFTLSKIVSDAGYQIDYLDYFEHGTLSRRQMIKKTILNRYPTFRDTLIIEIRL